MVRIGILGATGYTALELIKLLLRHPQAKIDVAHQPPGRPAAHQRDSSVADRPARSALEDLGPDAVAEPVRLCVPLPAARRLGRIGQGAAGPRRARDRLLAPTTA